MNYLEQDNSTTKQAKSLEKGVISIDECKKYLSKYNLSDTQIANLRNCIIGIADSVINTYLDEFETRK